MNQEIIWFWNIRNLLFSFLEVNQFQMFMNDLNHTYEQSIVDRVKKYGMDLGI